MDRVDQETHAFTCPHCWQEISVVVDLSVPAQRYVEDCEVCCRPIEIRCHSDGQRVTDFSAGAGQ